MAYCSNVFSLCLAATWSPPLQDSIIPIETPLWHLLPSHPAQREPLPQDFSKMWVLLSLTMYFLLSGNEPSPYLLGCMVSRWLNGLHINIH